MMFCQKKKKVAERKIKHVTQICIKSSHFLCGGEKLLMIITFLFPRHRLACRRYKRHIVEKQIIYIFFLIFVFSNEKTLSRFDDTE
jgi:hypothetical protein